MAAISINTNLPEVADRLIEKLKKLKDNEYLLRPVCVDLIDLMTKRIHIDGIDRDGGQIGTYNSAYLKYRQNKHKRTSDTKIIVSLTRQLENDWSVIATKNGYGIGFKNKFNLQKARWVEQIKDKNIFSLAGNELTHAKELLATLTNNALK
jgi:hypothetical protein